MGHRPVDAIDSAARLSYMNPQVEANLGYFLSKPIASHQLLAAVARAADHGSAPDIDPA
jgi:hypothetical protein